MTTYLAVARCSDYTRYKRFMSLSAAESFLQTLRGPKFQYATVHEFIDDKFVRSCYYLKHCSFGIWVD